MDWVPIVITVVTAAFLIPILREYQLKTGITSRKLLAVESQIREIEEYNVGEKEAEASITAELKEAEKELADLEKEYNELQKAIRSKKRKKR
jgi:chromosome segregation ATPase